MHVLKNSYDVSETTAPIICNGIVIKLQPAIIPINEYAIILPSFKFFLKLYIHMQNIDGIAKTISTYKFQLILYHLLYYIKKHVISI